MCGKKKYLVGLLAGGDGIVMGGTSSSIEMAAEDAIHRVPGVLMSRTWLSWL